MTRNALFFMFIVLAIILLSILNLSLGTIPIPFGDIRRIVLGQSDNTIAYNIVWKSRFPQALTALIAGAGLSISGLQMQTVFRNPLAGPSELGVSSGASLGVATIILLSGNIGGAALSRMGFVGEVAITVSAIIGAMSVMSLILFIAQRVRGNVVLLILGVMIGYIATAIIGVLKFFSNDEDVRSYVIWGLGSFSKVSGDQVYLFAIIMAILIPLSFLLIKSLNLMLLGDNYARNLGLNIRRTRLIVIGCSCVLTAIITAYCGPIIFLGLAVPHLCRTIFSTSNHTILVPAATLMGAALALLCNLIARMPGFEGALPINSVTALIGAPIVISVLFGKRKNEMN
ncbi:MAG: iron ABC transporter [Bacteroidales bacterium]|nr:MAG: iron ABC transporter [Bacteroidales bacterium]